MDEEKTIDEAVEEQADEMKEFEPVAFDEVIKEEPVKESAPVLRSGDPEPADMNMIHKHVDNFLAKIAGETPIDDNVRDSTEYWLNRISESGGGGGDKKYLHNIVVDAIHSGVATSFTLITNNSAKFTTIAKVCDYILANTSRNDVIVASGGGEYLNPTIVFWVTNLVHSYVDTIDVQGVQLYNNAVEFKTLISNYGVLSLTVKDTVIEL